MQSHLIINILSQTGIPFLMILAAGCVAAFKGKVLRYQPFARVFAGGVLLYCVGGHFLPMLHLKQEAWPIGLLLLLSWVLMAWLKHLHPSCCHSKAQTQSPLGVFLFGFAFEFLINGILIAMAAMAGHLAAISIAFSLALCMFSCGLTVALRLIQTTSVPATLIAMIGMALLCPLGGLLGVWILPTLSTFWLSCLMSFGLGILLYILIFDLIVPGFEQQTARLSFTFLIGFLVTMLLQAVS